MNVISIPFRLRVAAGILFFCVPLIALEVIIVNRVPWWNLPTRKIGYWCLAFSLICIPLVIWLLQAKRWTFYVIGVFMSTWLIASAVLAIRMHYPTLGFYSLMLTLIFGAEWMWLRYELTRSYIDPQLAWYQSLPKPIPGLKCDIQYEKKVFPLRVSRIDTDGVFVFSDPTKLAGPKGSTGKEDAVLSGYLQSKRLGLDFRFREHRLSCSGATIVAMGSPVQPNEGFGMGIQFLFDSSNASDLKKEISDFIELLRGEGYV
jgi:hypothetical protein